MSNSSYAIDQLRITRLSLAGEGAWPDLLIDNLSAQLNVFYGPPRAGKSSLAQLVGHLLFGKSERPRRRQFEQAVSSAAGTLQLAGRSGNYVLRRQHVPNRHDVDPTWRLTISSEQGDEVKSQTMRDLLCGLSPQLASQLFSVDFSESPRVEWLLSETFARDFSRSHSTASTRQNSCSAGSPSSIVDRVDRRRIDELVQRRDAIAGEIQQQMSVRCRESEVLERELHEVEAALTSHRERAARLQTELHTLETDLAELETRLRYFSLDRSAYHNSQSPDVDQQQSVLGELDNEIRQCRQTLAELQQRESLLRTELAQCSPDGTADNVTSLADGRRALGLLEQLLDDLDAEVSQLARSSDPGRCIGQDSHARLTPVAALLRQQVYTLCGQFTEQERMVHRQQLRTESRQLTRVHAELGDRLDLLLSRRESLIGRYQSANRPTRLLPQPPAADHCSCEHHGKYVDSASAMQLSRADHERHESDSRSQLDAVRRQRTQLLDTLGALQSDIDQLETRWENLQRERGGLMGGSSIEANQAELERLESVIRQSLHATEVPVSSTSASRWRASDLLAQLTDGQWVQIRLERQQSEATIVDRHGQPHRLESLSAAQRDQLYLALTLSLVSVYALRGVHLPLVLDEPFLQQDAASAAAMVGVLDEFARAGHQLLVFTEDYASQRRFATLSAKCFDLEAFREAEPDRRLTPLVHSDSPPATKPMAGNPDAGNPGAGNPDATAQTTNTRIVRETYDGHSTPRLRLAKVDSTTSSFKTSASVSSASVSSASVSSASVSSTSSTADTASKQEDAFYLSDSSSLSDFPVLGAETCTLFHQINILSVGDLLAADSAEIARQLDRDAVTAETVRLWQIHMGLMCHVPNLTLDDAQVLAASGIESPADLIDLDPEIDFNTLLRSIEAFLRSESGRRFDRSSGRYGRSRLNGWHTGANRHRDRWQRSSRRYSGWKTRLARPQKDRSTAPSPSPSAPAATSQRQVSRQEGSRQEGARQPRTQRPGSRQSGAGREPRQSSPAASRQSSQPNDAPKSRSLGNKRRRPHKFYLSLVQDVEDAPSIGPKTAERLAKVGIRTVADLLHADPESTAAELDVNHITAATVAAWQHQARLVCQIPQLRGYGAQLLVACGLTQPDQIAGTRPDDLVTQILTFCETKEGQRILRSGDAPERKKIADWVELAAQSRPLEAA